MTPSRRKQRKINKDIQGIAGIVVIISLLFTGGFYFYNLDSLDQNFCSVNNGPKALTAIIFDKSAQYNQDEVVDIKTSLNSWLQGEKLATKDRRIDKIFFSEGVLIQLYEIDSKSLSQFSELQIQAELCVPKDFSKLSLSNQLIVNQGFLEQRMEKFINTYKEAINNLLNKREGNSPIMESLVRISNSQSFQQYPDIQHNIFLVSDMLQNSDNYSHYQGCKKSGNCGDALGLDWSEFKIKMQDTIFYKPGLNGVNWTIFLKAAEGEDRQGLSLQSINTTDGKNMHKLFWEKYFNNAGAEKVRFINIDG